MGRAGGGTEGGSGGGERYQLLGADGRAYASATPGRLGGNRYGLYGRLDCPAALDALARGGPYRTGRVFFADEATAVAAGYRPCGVCLPAAYRVWRTRANRGTDAHEPLSTTPSRPGAAGYAEPEDPVRRRGW